MDKKENLGKDAIVEDEQKPVEETKEQEDLKEEEKPEEEVVEVEKKEEEDEMTAARRKCKAELDEKDAKIIELQKQVEELMPFKLEAEEARAAKEQEENEQKKAELRKFAQEQGLDVNDPHIEEAIETMSYEALVSAILQKPSETEGDPVVHRASTSIRPLNKPQLYGGLLEKQ